MFSENTEWDAPEDIRGLNEAVFSPYVNEKKKQVNENSYDSCTL
jgi:hypothetical protein